MVNLTPEINHEYDFSYSIPNLNAVYALTKYLYNEYENLLALIKADETNNEKYREEFKKYEYKSNYSERFNVRFTNRDGKYFTCDDLQSFNQLVETNKIQGIESLEIKVEFSFSRTEEGNLIPLHNIFKIKFKPFDTQFTRESNYVDSKYDLIENRIINFFNQLPKVDSIFNIIRE